MNRAIVGIACWGWLGLSVAACAQAMPDPADAGRAATAGPVVVELYTSQGCTACPPADALLADVARRDDVIALALHVDYWDYLGWGDPFAQPAFTARQKAYARAAAQQSVYTPQMIVAGHDLLEAPRAADLAALIARHAATGDLVQLSVRRDGTRLTVEARAATPLRTGAVVQLVRYLPHVAMTIGQGENAGRSVDMANVVTSWVAVADWDGRGPLSLTTAIEGAEPAVVIVQEAISGHRAPLPGPILAAARVE